MTNTTTSSRRPLPVAVHEALEIPDAPPDGLEPLKELIAAQTDPEYAQAKARLVTRLNEPLAPGQLMARNIDGVRVISAQRHRRDTDWPYGSYAQRHRLIRELLDDARWIGVGASRSLARAAVLLAAQEGFLHGAAWLTAVLADPQIDQLVQWPADRMKLLRARLDEERAQAGRVVRHMAEAGQLLQQLMRQPAPGLDPQQVEAFLAALEQMLGESEHRPEFQWRAANFAWMLVNLAAARGQQDVIETVRQAAARWRTAFPAPEFVRWIDEAHTVPWQAFDTPGVLFLTSDEVRARYVERPH